MILTNLELDKRLDLLALTHDAGSDDTDELAPVITLESVTLVSGRVLETKGIPSAAFVKNDEGDRYELTMMCKIDDELKISGNVNLMTGQANFIANQSDVVSVSVSLERVNNNRQPA